MDEGKFNKTKYKNQWQTTNCDRVNLVIKKGSKQAIQAVAESNGKSINGYIKEAIAVKYEADTGEKIEL